MLTNCFICWDQNQWVSWHGTNVEVSSLSSPAMLWPFWFFDRTNICDVRVAGLLDLLTFHTFELTDPLGSLVYCICIATSQRWWMHCLYLCNNLQLQHMLCRAAELLRIPGRGDMLRRCNLQAPLCSHHGQIPRLSAGVVASDQHLLQATMRWLSWIYDEGWRTAVQTWWNCYAMQELLMIHYFVHCQDVIYCKLIQIHLYTTLQNIDICSNFKILMWCCISYVYIYIPFSKFYRLMFFILVTCSGKLPIINPWRSLPYAVTCPGWRSSQMLPVTSSHRWHLVWNRACCYLDNLWYRTRTIPSCISLLKGTCMSWRMDSWWRLCLQNLLLESWNFMVPFLQDCEFVAAGFICCILLCW